MSMKTLRFYIARNERAEVQLKQFDQLVSVGSSRPINAYEAHDNDTQSVLRIYFTLRLFLPIV